MSPGKSPGLWPRIIHEETGLQLQPDFSEAEIRDAVKQMTGLRALSMRQACETRAGMEKNWGSGLPF